jgi:aspartyl-tRNA(Asn)/glutamyl-tRNA(Gln) amidotransferase subunit A
MMNATAAETAMPNATLQSLADDLAAGLATSRGLVEASLAAIADPAGEGARAFIRVDAAGARAAADYMDGLRRAGRAPSRLAGIPFSVKDLFDLAGEVTTAGSVVLKDRPPAVADAPAIARLKAAGLVVLGRTNMTEFAYSGVGINSHYGTPRAPFDRAVGRIPGGSSAGAAVAVADGLCALAIGTDTGGSCRIPAAYCGIVGFKPSHGRVPLAGAYPLAASLDSIGPLANSVACCATADALMAGDREEAVAARAPETLRLGVLRDLVLDGLETPVAGDFERSLGALGRAGVRIGEVRLPALAELPALNRGGGIGGAEAHHLHRPLLAARGADYDPLVRTRLELPAAMSADELLGLIARRRAMIAGFAAVCEGFDAVVLPSVMNTPPAIAELAAPKDYARLNAMALRNTAVGNFLDACALSLPMHEAGAAPTGFMLMAPGGRDRALLAAAAAVEAVFRRPP